MPVIKAIEVRLEVGDIPRSVQFYSAVLGFEAGTLWPQESPQFAILSRDGLRLQLGKAEGESAPSHDPSATLWLDVVELESLHARIMQVTDIEWGPEVHWYGRREFAFRDPDRHLIIVSEATCDPPTCGGG